jgi:hypothetical protein
MDAGGEWEGVGSSGVSISISGEWKGDDDGVGIDRTL